jgi:hypothetical protein
MSATGLVAQSPTALNAQLIAQATALVPSLTTNLPGSLIEDISSTDTGALIVMDQARQDVISSITPLGANPFLLYQLGQIYGVTPGQSTNANCNIIISTSPPLPGFVIPQGFVVSDGTNQYTLPDGGVTATGGSTQPLLAVATNSNTFPIPAGSVNQIITSIPTSITATTTVTVSNPLIGNPAAPAETISQYRGEVLQAGLVASTGTIPFLKTLISAVPGVNPNLIAAPVAGGVTQIIVGGGGDQFLIAGAIFQSGIVLSLLGGSTLSAISISIAAAALLTVSFPPGWTVGESITVASAATSGYNGTFTISSITSPTQFVISLNSSGLGAYTGGGICTPNPSNVVVSINDFPDTYEIPYVIPPAQPVTMAVGWNTIGTNFVSAASVSALASTALANYINSLSIGEPINLNVMSSIFQTSVVSILSANLLSTLTFSVTINGTAVSPESGTELIFGSSIGFFTTTSSAIVVEQI